MRAVAITRRLLFPEKQKPESTQRVQSLAKDTVLAACGYKQSGEVFICIRLLLAIGPFFTLDLFSSNNISHVEIQNLLAIFRNAVLIKNHMNKKTKHKQCLGDCAAYSDRAASEKKETPCSCRYLHSSKY